MHNTCMHAFNRPVKHNNSTDYKEYYNPNIQLAMNVIAQL